MAQTEAAVARKQIPDPCRSRLVSCGACPGSLGFRRAGPGPVEVGGDLGERAAGRLALPVAQRMAGEPGLVEERGEPGRRTAAYQARADGPGQQLLASRLGTLARRLVAGARQTAARGGPSAAHGEHPSSVAVEPLSR